MLTVSPTYAQEMISDPSKSVGLEEFFKSGRVTGILNGVKEGISPSEPSFVKKAKMTCGAFTAATMSTAKAKLKATYRAQNGLPAINGPMMCFIGRLDAQKGYDLLLESLMEVLENTDMQMVVVGAGRSDLIAQTRVVEKRFPGKFFYAGCMGTERYALLAACDYTLLPSRWEPCGLVQMEAMRMGTCPIVAPTGGLKDTVKDGLNGIWTDREMTTDAEICDESAASVSRALERAVKIFVEDKKKLIEMQRAAAAAEFCSESLLQLEHEAIVKEHGVKNVFIAGRKETVNLQTEELGVEDGFAGRKEESSLRLASKSNTTMTSMTSRIPSTASMASMTSMASTH